MVEKIKTDVDRPLLVLKMKTKFRYILLKVNFFKFRNQNLSTKPIYLLSFFPSLTFPKFWKQNFMYFGHKHVETLNQ